MFDEQRLEAAGKHFAVVEMAVSEADIESFLNNIPFAFDHSGADISINLVGGSVWLMDWEAYEKGPIELSPSFRDFVLKHRVNSEPFCEATS